MKKLKDFIHPRIIYHNSPAGGVFPKVLNPWFINSRKTWWRIEHLFTKVCNIRKEIKKKFQTLIDAIKVKYWVKYSNFRPKIGFVDILWQNGGYCWHKFTDKNRVWRMREVPVSWWYFCTYKGFPAPYLNSSGEIITGTPHR